MTKTKACILALSPALLTGCRTICRRVLADELVVSVGGVVNAQGLIITRVWWLVPVAILGMAAGAFLLVQGSMKLGLGVIIACGAALGLSITVFQHFVLIAWLGFGIAAVGVLYAFYQAYIQRKAIAELVRTVEVVKPQMAAQAQIEVFGPDDKDHGLAGTIQSKATEALVTAERKKLPK